MELQSETIPSLLENRRNGRIRMCRVRIEVLLEHPHLFDYFYDLAETRLGGPLSASQALDAGTMLSYVYFWNAVDRVVTRRTDSAVEA